MKIHRSQWLQQHKPRDPNLVFKNPLIQAASIGDINTVKQLVYNGAYLDEMDYDFENFAGDALFWACRYDQKEVVQFLVQQKIDINRFGFRGLDKIEDFDKLSIISGTTIVTLCTPLMVACRFNSPEIVRILIDAGANLNICDNNGYTALCIAACHAYYKCAKLLILAGADLHIRNTMQIQKSPHDYFVDYLGEYYYNDLIMS